MNKELRMISVLEWIQSGRYDLDGLVQQVYERFGEEQNPRSIERDIKELKTTYGVDIRKQRKGPYHIEGPSDIFKDPLIQSFKRFQLLKQLNVSSSSAALPITFDSMPDKRTEETLMILLQAIKDRIAVGFTYRTYDGGASSRTVEPYHIEEYDKVYYLHGAEVTEGEVKSFRFNAISELSLLPEATFIKKDLDLDQTARAFIGINNSGNTIEPVLRVSARLAQFIQEQPLHHSQQTIARNDDGSIHVRLVSKHNDELIGRILKYDRHITVLEPLELKQDLVARVQALLNNYNP